MPMEGKTIRKSPWTITYQQKKRDENVLLVFIIALKFSRVCNTLQSMKNLFLLEAKSGEPVGFQSVFTYCREISAVRAQM